MEKAAFRLAVNFLSATAISLISTATGADGEIELSGKIGMEQRFFFQEGDQPQQLQHSQSSVAFVPELYWSANGGRDSFTFTAFYRIDNQDEERSHGDIRELSYIRAGDDWEFRAGIRKVFWGVAEFQHLVDVINQTDNVEDFDGEDKLGQLMLNLSVVNDWGIVDVFLLPGFRPRQFNGEEGRLRGPILIDNDDIDYQSSEGKQHVDLALRWSHSIGDFDIGSYWFHGTNREPLLILFQENDAAYLRQYYQQMNQFGFDLQATLGSWLWKFESIYRHTDDFNYWATQAGFEYTFIGVLNSNADLGLLMEHGWDARGKGDEAMPGSSFQNDLFWGARIAFNDTQSSEILFGLGSDLEHYASSFVFEASRRLGESFKLDLDIRLIKSSEQLDPLYQFKNDDHLQLTIEWYF